MSRSAPPSACSAAVLLPVRSRITPTSVGPTKPPGLPTELMNAMPPAAAVPVRTEVPTAQKGPVAAFRPMNASVSAPATRRSGRV
jgi:hypothetical protein